MNRALALVIVAACGKKANCKQDVQDLMSFLNAMDHTVSAFHVDADMQLATRTDVAAAQVPPAPVIVLKPNEMTLEGRVIAVADLESALFHEGYVLEVTQRADDKRDRSELHVVVDERVPWQRVVEVATIAERDFFTHVGFAFARPSSVQPPPRTWVDDELDKPDANPGTLVTGIVKVCKPLQKLYAEAKGEVGDKTQHIIDGTGAALLDCDCNVDLAALRSSMWRTAGNPHPMTVLLTRISKEGTRIELPAATPWSEANKQLTPGHAVWLVASER